MGAWVNYGLGSECRDLPGFVVLGSGMIPPGGMDCFGSGFLPVAHQGSLFQRGDQPVADLQARESIIDAQQSKLSLMKALDDSAQRAFGSDEQLEAAIANYELAFRMQTAVPELMDFSDETAATLKRYGIDRPET
jgi:hypothetical protein